MYHTANLEYYWAPNRSSFKMTLILLIMNNLLPITRGTPLISECPTPVMLEREHFLVESSSTEKCVNYLVNGTV